MTALDDALRRREELLGAIAPAGLDHITRALVELCFALPDTDERCPDCERRGGGWEWAGHGPPQYASRPCPTCTVDAKPTGRVPRSWGSVLLGALPRNCEACPDGAGTGCKRICFTRWKADESDREALAVKSDELQAAGDPLGLWLAMLLAEHPDLDIQADAIAERLDALTAQKSGAALSSDPA